MYQEKINRAKNSMEEGIQFLKGELAKIKTGRASSELVSDIQVECYGSKTQLKQLATINVPEAQMITVQPYDKNVMGDIEKAIQASGLGLNPVNDGNLIRISIPPLNEERRKEIVSIVGQKLEEARVSVRKAREESWREIKELEASGSITEDDKYKAQDELNKVTEEYNNKLEELGKAKEEEIMNI